jgi:8-oxo-dGTP diphosphatase
VAAGILRDADDRVLITERLGDSPFAGLWEFPGGKIDDGETAPDALRRELDEELGIEIVVFEHFMHLRHDYDDRRVKIDFFMVSEWHGRPAGIEGQGLRWLAADLLDEQDLLPADAPVVRALRERDWRRSG